MTLIDTRPGVAAVMRALSAETGVWIDADLVVGRLGPPLDDELANWFPADQVPVAADRSRALYPDLAIEPVEAMPGAVESFAAIRAAGGGSWSSPPSTARTRSCTWTGSAWSRRSWSAGTGAP